ncbi:MAG: hypothetical protein MRY63_14800 [Neomegalonema sp.]|nr:hypothetical protein [Neomegalonema sp.]
MTQSPSETPGFTSRRLNQLVIGFMNARGFDGAEAAPGIWIGTRPVADGTMRHGAVLIPSRLGVAAVDVDWAISAVLLAQGKGVEGRIPIVVTSRRGLSSEDMKRIVAAGGTVLYPLQFIDWYFRRDQSADDEDAATGIDEKLRKVIDQDLIRLRAPQPYRRLTHFETEAGSKPVPDGEDLFRTLFDEMRQFPEGPRLRVICGHAGVGKTVLVNVLVDRLRTAFNEAKTANRIAARPMFFSPDDLGSTVPESVDELIEEVQGTDVTRHVPPDAFHWLHEEGFSIWVFDGLDEFYRRQNDFFEVIERKLSDRNGLAQIIISTRDSLLSSSPHLLQFLEQRRRIDPDSVEVLELVTWDAPAKRAFIEIKLRESAEEPSDFNARVDQILTRLEEDPGLQELTALPFYCDLYVGALLDGREEALGDEFSLLQSAVDALIERESGKLSVDWDVFVSESEEDEVQKLAQDAMARGLVGDGQNPFMDALRQYGQDNLEYLLGGAAHFYRFAAEDARPLSQISVSEWSEVLSPAYIDASLDEETEKRVQLALMQFAFFARGEGGDHMTFVHDLIADYLAGKYAFALIDQYRDRPEAVRQAIGTRSPIDHTVFYRYIKHRVAQDEDLIEAMGAALQSPKLKEPARSIVAKMMSEISAAEAGSAEA